MGGIIVVADTHFGIKEGGMPGYFADFIKYIRDIEIRDERIKNIEMKDITLGDIEIMDEDHSIKIYDGTIRKKTLKKPDKIIFLGDVVELWDSEDEAVNFSMSSLLPILSEIEAEKVYALGNHDNILKKATLDNYREYYWFGKSKLTLVENQYPPDSFLAVGDQNYLFVHGHQFDKHFTNVGRLYNILPALRKLSNSLTWCVPFLFLISLAVQFERWIVEYFSLTINVSVPIPDLFVDFIKFIIRNFTLLGEKGIFVLLLFLTVPKLYIIGARPLWNKFNRVKYDERGTIKNFTKWWKREFAGNDEEIPKNIIVVYGHTHFLNYLNLQEDESGKDNMYDFYLENLDQRSIENKPTLINISAWIKDIKKSKLADTSKSIKDIMGTTLKIRMKKGKKKREDSKEREEFKDVMIASFLYIDEEGFEFFGWKWRKKEVFHIPKIAICERRKSGRITDGTAAILRELGWPEILIKKWKREFTLSQTILDRIRSFLNSWIKKST